MWVPFGVKYHIPMELFYRLNPNKMMRYQPYMNEWMKQNKHEESEVGWVNGLYVSKAVAAVVSKGAKYPEEAIDFFGVGNESGSETEETPKISDADIFAGFAIQFNKANEGRFKKPIIDADIVSVDGQEVAKSADISE